MLSRLLLFVCVLSVSTSALAQSELSEPQLAARDELDQGVIAFRAAHYKEATQHFNKSVRLDPELNVARLYLATAYAQEYVPGVETDANVGLANRALEQYAEVLHRDSANVTAVKGIAFLQMQLKHLSEAKEGYEKAAKLDPTDPEAFYSIGVLDWSMVYRDLAAEKSKLNLRMQDTIPGARACSDLRSKMLPNINNGMAMLKQAMTLRPDYADAMAYMRELYRVRADVDCDKAARETDIAAAEKWSDLAMAARRKQAEAEKKRTQDAGAGDNSR